MEILAFIGLIAVLMLLSKGLRALGSFFSNIGDAMISYSEERWKEDKPHRVKHFQTKSSHSQEKEDEQRYQERVRQEIDKLTRTDL